ncbi:septum formation family protein [Kitasatospora sp. NPDC004289]
MAVTAVVAVVKGPAVLREAGERARAAERPFEPGECFRGDGDGLERSEQVPCTEPHRMEVFSSFAMDDREYPGKEALFAMATMLCRRAQSAYVLDWMTIPRATRTGMLLPSHDTWRQGDRTVVCHFAHPRPRQGSLAKDSSEYQPEQSAYLTADRTAARAHAEWPIQEPSQAPDEYRRFAASLAKALRAESAQLDATHWSEGPQRELPGLKAELEAHAQQADRVVLADSIQLPTEISKLSEYTPTGLRFRATLSLPTAQQDTP